MSAQTTLPEVAPATPQPDRPKKKLLRRLEPDRSQPLRRAFQLAFLILNVILGVQFYLWVQAAMRRPFPAGRSRSESPCCSWEQWVWPRQPATGIPTSPARFIWNWSRTPTRPRTPCPGGELVKPPQGPRLAASY